MKLSFLDASTGAGMTPEGPQPAVSNRLAPRQRNPMRSAKTRRKELRIEVALILTMALILTSACGGHAQDASSSSAASSGNPSESLNPGDSSQPPSGPSQPPVVQAAGQLSPLSRAAGQVLVGDIALQSVELNETWNQLNVVNTTPANTASTGAPTLSTGLLMDIGYDRQFRRTRLSFQYTPSLYVVNGHLIKSFDNQHVSLSLGFQLRPRIFLNIADAFLYNGSQNLAANQYFTSDFTTQTVLQNPFLSISGYYLYDQMHVDLSYLLSARTKLTVSPGYSYTKTVVNPNSAAAAAAAASNTPVISIDRDEGVVIAVDHQLSSTKGMGVFYSFDRSYFNQTFGTSYFNTVGLRYSQVLQPTLRFAASVGVSGAYGVNRQPSSATVLGTSATVVGTLSLMKTFRKSQVSVAYSRGYGGSSGFVSPGYTDRLDVAYGRQMTRRWTVGLSGAYMRGTTTAGFTGSYASVNTGYLLTPTISWFATYGIAQELGLETPFFPGAHSFVTTGLRWNPARIRIGTQPNPR